MIPECEPTVLVVSDDACLCTAARRELESRGPAARVTAVSGVEAARRVVENSAPVVILLDAACAVARPDEGLPQINSIVAALAVFAPVVIIAEAQHQEELSALLAAGAASFVPRGTGALPAALRLVQQRLQHSQRLASHAQEVMAMEQLEGERFSEVLRHELNNPLTGILGNAELLLAEVRRKNDGRMPQGGQQRLETIAALAMRLRETVRRLSEQWETREHVAQ